MIRYIARSIGAHARAGRSLYLLTIAGVAMGVASAFSIQIINRSALAAFAGTMGAVSAGADLSVVGRTPDFDENVLETVLGTQGVLAAWPLYRTSVSLEAAPSILLDVLGFDFYMPVTVPFTGDAGDGSDALSVPGWVAVTPALAGEMGWEVGDSVAVTKGTRRAWLHIGALVDFQKANPLASRKLAVMDIAQAQHALGGAGRIHQIDIRTARDDDGTIADELRRRLGPSVQVMAPRQRRAEAAGLLSAFRLNLTALSFISLFVGIFLVYSSTHAALVRRRVEFGVLRSLGATRAQVLGVILAEVLILGVLGVAAGIPLGYLAATLNVDVVSATLTNLYLLSEIERLELPAWTFATAAGAGVIGAMLGALVPALDMARRDTKSLLAAYTLHEKTRSVAPHLFLAGVAILGVTGAWYGLYGHGWQPSGFVLATALVVALPLLAPAVVVTLTRGVAIRSFDMRFSMRSLGTSLQSTSVAVAALSIAVTMLVGITLMIGSFRRTLTTWMRSTVTADLYITTPSWRGAGRDAPIATTLIQTLVSDSAVKAIDRLRAFPAYAGNRRVAMIAVDFTLAEGDGRFALTGRADPANVDAAVAAGAVLISEPLSRKAGLGRGDTVRVTGPDGEIAMLIAGVYFDYGNESGTIAADLRQVERWYGPGDVNSIAVYLRPGMDPDATIDRLRATFREYPLLIRSNRRLREQALDIFDQTFAITRLLQLMSLVIAVAGITLTLLVLARERVSELALYRSLGAQRDQIFRFFVGKGLGISAVGVVLGTFGGVLLAFILVFVINRAYFGWTIQLHLPWAALFAQLATIVAAALLASIYPALRASRIPGTELSREDV